MNLQWRGPAGRRTPALAVALALQAAGVPAWAADSAVVFMYHRFGETAYPTTNIRIEQFESHIKELKNGKYAVLPLPEIVAALREKRSLPDNAVALTVDDAFASVYTEAWPRLKAAGLPFTLFVATDPIDGRTAGMMSWDQVRELAGSGVTIGAHTASHGHMPERSMAENTAEIEKSNARFKAELGGVPGLFAYPYGEMSRAIGALAEKSGYRAAFGQHSGVAWTDGNFYYLPRFALNEHYGDLDRFRLAARALPLPARDIIPADPMLGPGNNPPLFGFTVAEEVAKGAARLECYVSSQGKARIERLDRRIEVRMPRAFAPGRGRINCTMPARDGRWRWFGMQFYIPK
jgi:peptidoglycan/xylan/chitin deacetylase (PgdA/CDA1 family)